SAGRGGGIRTIAAAMTIGQLFQLMTLRIDGPRAAGLRLRVQWILTDRAQTWNLSLANGVLTPTAGGGSGGAQPDLVVQLDRSVCERMLSGQLTIGAGAAPGLATVAGDAAALTALFDLLETPRAAFNVATP